MSQTTPTNDPAETHTQPDAGPSNIVSARDDAPVDQHVSNPGGGLTIGLIFLVVVLCGVGYGIWVRHSSEHELIEQTRNDAAQIVSVIRPTAGSDVQELKLPGNVQAYTETPIYSRTNGYLKNWYYDIGQHVKQGALLAVIETPEVDQQLLQSRSELNRMEANAKLAETTSDRWQSLLAKHAVSQQEADQTRSNYIAAQAAVDASRANVRRLEQLQSYERILAPFDGVITARNTDIGDLINAGSNGGGSGAAPRELFHLAAAGKMRVFAAVPEVYADLIRNGGTVTITHQSDPTRPLIGTIVRNANAIDNVTRTLNVESNVDNKDGRLLPGAYVFVHFKLPVAAGHFMVPSNTLIFRSEGPRLAIVRDNKVHLQPIMIGHDYGDRLEILSGISENDQIVVDPPDSLSEGAEVRPEEQKKRSQNE